MRLLVCGSRTWTNENQLFGELDATYAIDGNWHNDFVVGHGAHSTGADALADAWAQSKGVRVERWPADWNRYGKAAGPLRNRKMLAEFEPDMVVAFRAYGKSPGTDDMVWVAMEAGVTVVLIREAEQ